MSKITLPENYQSLLGLYDTQKAIGLIKTIFQEKICMALHLKPELLSEVVGGAMRPSSMRVTESRFSTVLKSQRESLWMSA